MLYEVITNMDNNKGSLILKAFSPDADKAQAIAYLERRAQFDPLQGRLFPVPSCILEFSQLHQVIWPVIRVQAKGPLLRLHRLVDHAVGPVGGGQGVEDVAVFADHRRGEGEGQGSIGITDGVITSYSIHYTKLYDTAHEVMVFAGQELQSWSARLFGEFGLVVFDPLQFAGNNHPHHIIGYRQRNRDFDLSVGRIYS